MATKKKAVKKPEHEMIMTFDVTAHYKTNNGIEEMDINIDDLKTKLENNLVTILGTDNVVLDNVKVFLW